MCRAQADTNASRRTRKNKPPAPVFQRVDNAVHWVNQYPVDSAIVCPNTYILDSDLSGEWRYPTFEQPGAPFHPK